MSLCNDVIWSSTRAWAGALLSAGLYFAAACDSGAQRGAGLDVSGTGAAAGMQGRRDDLAGVSGARASAAAGESGTRAAMIDSDIPPGSEPAAGSGGERPTVALAGAGGQRASADGGSSGASTIASSAGRGGSTEAQTSASTRYAFILGADISSVPEHNYTFIDTDGQQKTIFALLQAHGFNYVRVKTFVDPSAPHGYASTVGGCEGLSEPFSDRDHIVAFGRKIKDAGMGFLLDFHYSDTWADPGKQHIPERWRDAASIDELSARLKAYTLDVLHRAVAAGARPDMVQIGNEITPGMLMHVPGPETDCWGNQPMRAPLGGGTDNWDNLASLLRAGIAAVREVDPTIQVLLHIENTDDLPGAMRWVSNALQRQLDFDVLGLSCYTAFQGEPSVWSNTFEALAKAFPALQFIIAEYNPSRTRANTIMLELPDRRGLGTFLWEPTRSGSWGSALFDQQGDTMTARSDFEEFDALVPMLAR